MATTKIGFKMFKRNMIFCENTALGLVKDKKLQLFEKRLFVPRNDFAKNEGHFAKKMRAILRKNEDYTIFIV